MVEIDMVPKIYVKSIYELVRPIWISINMNECDGNLAVILWDEILQYNIT